MTESEIKRDYESFVIACYGKDDAVFVKGKGCYLWDVNGRKYLDFFPGWAVSGLGHCPPAVSKAVCGQAKTLMHVANNFYHPGQAAAAKKLVEMSFPGKVFFCNSGAEANEAAIKLCRLYGSSSGRYGIISLKNSFHGRTLATVTLTGQGKYSEPFKPLPEGFAHADFNDFESLKALTGEKTVAVFLELIQGEGGINVARPEYVSKVRDFCREKDLLLVFDEVQTGFGRTGRYFAFQHYGVEPDIMTLAKTLGSGFPLGALVAKPALSGLLKPGTHASTFGGSPLACSAALAAMETLENLSGNVAGTAAFLRKGLDRLKEKFPLIKEIRGVGLMLGVELEKPGAELVKLCRKNGLLVNCTHETVIRIMPPLCVKKTQIREGLKILESSLTEFTRPSSGM